MHDRMKCITYVNMKIRFNYNAVESGSHLFGISVFNVSSNIILINSEIGLINSLNNDFF